jgi:hypothetical protein
MRHSVFYDTPLLLPLNDLKKEINSFLDNSSNFEFCLYTVLDNEDPNYLMVTAPNIWSDEFLFEEEINLHINCPDDEMFVNTGKFLRNVTWMTLIKEINESISQTGLPYRKFVSLDLVGTYNQGMNYCVEAVLIK